MPSRVDFYLLDAPTLKDKSVYACRLAAKAFSHALKVFLRVEDEAQTQALDKLLWCYAQGSFVPHTITHGQVGQAERFAVQIGTQAPSDCRDMLIGLCPEVPDDFAEYARIAEVVSAEPQDKAAARQRYRFYQQHGLTPATHQITAA